MTSSTNSENTDDLGMTWLGLLVGALLFALLAGAGGGLVISYQDSSVVRFLFEREESTRSWYGDLSGNREVGAVSGTALLLVMVFSWYVARLISKRFPKDLSKPKMATWKVYLFIALAILVPVVLVMLGPILLAVSS